MTLMSGNDWSDVGDKNVYEAEASSDFENQAGKPVKALVGIVLLIVFALILGRMNPAPHEISSAPAWSTGQTAGSSAR